MSSVLTWIAPRYADPFHSRSQIVGKCGQVALRFVTMTPSTTPVRALSALPSAVLAIFCGSAGAAALKLLTVTPPGQAIAERSAVAGVILLIWSLVQGRGRLGVMSGTAWLRAVLDAIAAFTFALAIFELPLSLLTAINMSVPIVAMVVAAVLLKETVTRRQVVAIAVGFAGIVIVVQPNASAALTGIAFAVTSTFAYALRDAANRRIQPGSSGAQTALVSVMLAGTCGALLSGTTRWVAPPAIDVVAIGLTGVCYVASSTLIIKALRSAPLTVVSTLRYTAIFWAMLFDFLIDGRVPGLPTLLGAALVILSGLILMRPMHARRFIPRRKDNGQP